MVLLYIHAGETLFKTAVQNEKTVYDLKTKIATNFLSLTKYASAECTEVDDEEGYLLPDDLCVGDSLKENQHLYVKIEYQKQIVKIESSDDLITEYRNLQSKFIMTASNLIDSKKFDDLKPLKPILLEILRCATGKLLRNTLEYYYKHFQNIQYEEDEQQLNIDIINSICDVINRISLDDHVLMFNLCSSLCSDKEYRTIFLKDKGISVLRFLAKSKDRNVEYNTNNLLKTLAIEREEEKKVELLDLVPLLPTADTKIRLFLLKEIDKNPKDGQIFLSSIEIDVLLKFIKDCIRDLQDQSNSEEYTEEGDYIHEFSFLIGHCLSLIETIPKGYNIITESTIINFLIDLSFEIEGTTIVCNIIKSLVEKKHISLDTLILCLQNGNENLQRNVIKYITNIIETKSMPIEKYVPIIVRISQSIPMGQVLYDFTDILCALSITNSYKNLIVSSGGLYVLISLLQVSIINNNMPLQRSTAKAICNLAASEKSTRKVIIERMKQDITSIDHIKDDLARVYLETVLP